MASEKTDWKNEYKQIKKRISGFEIDILKQFPFTQTTTLKSELISLHQAEERLFFDRAKEREDIFISLAFLRREIRGFKEKLKYFDKSDDSLRKIEELTLGLESRISEFQGKQMKVFDALTNEEERLGTELEVLNSRLDSYETSQRFSENKQKTHKYRSASAIPEEENEDLGENPDNSFVSDKENQGRTGGNGSLEDFPDFGEDEIGALDKELEKLKEGISAIDRRIRTNGGVNCGWSDEDHKDFLRLRTKHKNSINSGVFLEDCLSIFPLMTRKDVCDHIERFRGFLGLDSEKKGLVETYKVMKEDRRRRMLVLIDEEQRNEEKRKAASGVQRREEQERQQKMREELKEWKRKKLSLRELEVEKRTVEEIERKRQESRKLQEKKEKVAERLKEFKESKEQERLMKATKEVKKVLDPVEIERIKGKQQVLLEKKRELIERKRLSEEEKRRKQEKLLETKNVRFGYVESRLNEETKAIIGKKTGKFDPQKGDQPKLADTFGGMLGKGPSRAIPLWRQGN